MHPLCNRKMETWLFIHQPQTEFVAETYWSNCHSMNSLQPTKKYPPLINYSLTPKALWWTKMAFVVLGRFM
jgi:hypothetical protein